MVQVFISYKSEYLDFARRLRDQLLHWGYQTWLDRDNIREGHYWRDEIDAGLAASDIVVGVVTPESLASRNVLNEWYTALDTNKHLLLLILHEADLTLRHSLNQIQRIDFTGGEENGFHQLRHALKTPSAAPVISRTEPPPRQPDPNRLRMLQKVQDYWVKGVLEHALHENRAFKLGLAAAPGAVLRHREYGDYTLPADVSQIFRDMNSELLILGAPGSGKTILLLQLARVLIQQAQQDETQPIPVVFNLSSWAAQRKSIAEWLKDELRTKYQVPKKVARQWVEGEKLLLLLDGLDEVAAAYRDDCVEAINAFRHDYRFVNLAVCSRVIDYESLTHKLDLQGAVVLQPLTDAQIATYIRGDDLAGLRQSLQHDETLQTLARTPFLLNTMAFAYHGLSAVNLALSGGNEKERTTHLFDKYIERRLQTANPHYTPRETQHYLHWLARKMVAVQQTVFYIESMQPEWLDTPRQRFECWMLNKVGIGLAYGLSFGVMFGLLTGITFALAVNLEHGLTYGAAVMVVLVLGLGTIAGAPVKMGEIEVGDAMNFRWSRGDIVWGIYNAIVIGVVVILFGLLIDRLRVAVVVSLAAAMVGFLEAGLKSAQHLELRSIPNQGIYRSFWNAAQTGLLIALVTGLVSGLVSALVVDVSTGIGTALILGGGIGVFLALSFGIRSVVRHLVLRFLLSRAGVIPLNYAAFLDYACRDLVVLRRVGGGYLYIHRMLLEYFAD